MRAADDSQQLFPLTREDAFAIGRLSCLRSIAIGLEQARRDLGDATAAADVAERVHVATHDLMLQLFGLGAKSNVEIRSTRQAERACAKGQLGLYAAYLAGSIVESDWYLDRASEAHGSHSLADFAASAVSEIRARVAQQLAGGVPAEVREHPWIPDANHLPGGDHPASMYMVTSTVGDSTLWVTDVGQRLLQQASELHFTPVPETEFEREALAAAR